MLLNLTSKIELLQEQIDNLEKSGFFTESEMDRACVSLRIELDYFQRCISLSHIQVIDAEILTPNNQA